MTSSKKFYISLFILLNFLTMIRIHMPLNTPFLKAIYSPVDKYLSFFSIYQDWMMFSPNPTRLDSYLSAEVQFIDGTKSTYQFPRTSEMSITHKHMYGEKFRKLTSESIRRNDKNFMWHDTAKFAIRQTLINNNYEKLPIKVKLFRHWAEVKDVNQEFLPHREKLADYKSYNFYSYGVSP
jgi:hypothetical protein